MILGDYADVMFAEVYAIVILGFLAIMGMIHLITRWRQRRARSSGRNKRL